MADKAWKAAERRSAAFFKTTRTPLSGSNSKHTGSDTLHDNLFVEAKQGKGWQRISRLFSETTNEAEKEGKMPVVCIHPKNMQELLIFRRKDVKKLVLTNGGEYGESVDTQR